MWSGGDTLQPGSVESIEQGIEALLVTLFHETVVIGQVEGRLLHRLINPGLNIEVSCGPNYNSAIYSSYTKALAIAGVAGLCSICFPLLGYMYCTARAPTLDPTLAPRRSAS